eukprot:PITA_01220
MITRQDFPSDFIFGAGTSAYQVEGAAALDGRKPSIWDTFTHAGNMPDKSTGDVAADQYHHYKEDVALMSEMGKDFQAYAEVCFREFGDRVKYWTTFNEANTFPIMGYDHGEWPPQRCSYPFGNCSAGNSTVEPYIVGQRVLLSHAATVELYREKFQKDVAFMSEMGKDFQAYAEVCFREFGDRVKYWTTFNEANAFPILGYDLGVWPPQRCSYPFGNCSAGNSTVEPYIVGQRVLLSHEATIELYREKFQVQYFNPPLPEVI